MSRIKILDEQVVNRIAAGEIIERPASVVKELLENSLDANATNITINIENGGKKLIQVADNGSGMTKDDALLSIERHATSKIYELDDIHHISTLGFRGEALPSIAAVSEMEITSLPQNSKNKPATQITIEGGNIKRVSEIASNPGTIIKVKNIFKNIPAREKFLKTPQTEMHHIIKNVQYLACTHYETGFRLIHNGKEVLNYPKVNLLEKRITDIFGSKFFQKNIIPIQTESFKISIQGYIGSFEEGVSWPSSGWRVLFVNNRYVNNKIVYSAIRRAYEPFTKKSLLKAQQPLYIIFITMPNEEIDFNVSPTKIEVRFVEPNLVFNFVKNAITDFLLDYENQKYAEIKSNAEKTYAYTEAKSIHGEQFRFKSKIKKSPRFSSYKEELDNIFRPKSATTQLTGSQSQSSENLDAKADKEKREIQLVSFFNEKIIKDKNKVVETEIVNPWQAGRSFIFVETKNGILAIDQHAAHERILYEQILVRITKSSQSTIGQKLLFPLVMDLPKYLQKTIPDLVEQNVDTFKQIGFKIKIFSGNSLIIEEIPQDLHNWNNGEVLLNILQQLDEEYQPQMDFKEKLAASYACHAAIKAGQKLSKKEMLALINDLFAAKNPFFCPHGRPTIIEISFEELQKRFKRT